ncbi:MAG: hypothetical protein VKO64_10645 [Candidatus Sericytochromatia bacterium]|nr:hypothetical protein [Candidatus Sericytochromatia bacterium]
MRGAGRPVARARSWIRLLVLWMVVLCFGAASTLLEDERVGGQEAHHLLLEDVLACDAVSLGRGLAGIPEFRARVPALRGESGQFASRRMVDRSRTTSGGVREGCAMAPPTSRGPPSTGRGGPFLIRWRDRWGWVGP